MSAMPIKHIRGTLALKASLGRIAWLLEEYPQFQAKYDQAREVMGIFARPTFYEVTSRCNLHCRGCYYFEGGFDPVRKDVTSIEAWDDFFAAEARRGVTMGQYFGGEPALVQEVLRTAVKYIPYGNIGTNGTIRIDPEIQARIHISVWGGKESDAAWRGKSVFGQAVKNYAGDPRAIAAYTLNGRNLSEAREIAGICRDNGLRLTFSMFSPTSSYRQGKGGENDDGGDFHAVAGGGTQIFSAPALMAAREVVAGLLDDFPETILYSRDYNSWVTTPGPLFEIDPETGWATNCGSRIKDHFQVIFPDLKKSREKCCHAGIVCAECRVYGAGFSSRLSPATADLTDLAGFVKWLDFMELFRKIFVYRPLDGVPPIEGER
jgi:hypothetical protein